MRLRTVSPNDAGWTRRKAGSGFVYLDGSGQRLPREDVERIKSLVVPPAWQQVRICPRPNGHLQVVGTDAAGRRQYMYHPEWRRQRDEAKFDRILTMARALPRARLRILADLEADGLGEQRVLALIAATSLADKTTAVTSSTVRKRAIRQAVVEVSEYLGNTPTIARKSYIDPRVIDLYQDGTTIAHALLRAPEQPQQRQEHLEQAVLRVLSRAPRSAQRSSRAETTAR